MRKISRNSDESRAQLHLFTLPFWARIFNTKTQCEWSNHFAATKATHFRKRQRWNIFNSYLQNMMYVLLISISVLFLDNTKKRYTCRNLLNWANRLKEKKDQTRILARLWSLYRQVTSLLSVCDVKTGHFTNQHRNAENILIPRCKSISEVRYRHFQLGSILINFEINFLAAALHRNAVNCDSAAFSGWMPNRITKTNRVIFPINYQFCFFLLNCIKSFDRSRLFNWTWSKFLMKCLNVAEKFAHISYWCARWFFSLIEIITAIKRSRH